MCFVMVEKNAMYLLQIIELQDFKKEKCSDVKKITETGRFGGNGGMRVFLLVFQLKFPFTGPKLDFPSALGLNYSIIGVEPLLTH